MSWPHAPSVVSSKLKKAEKKSNSCISSSAPRSNAPARLKRARAILEDGLSCAIVGGPETVRRGLDDFARRTGADELMVTANIFDHEKRKRSFEIVTEIHGEMKEAARCVS